MASCTDFITMGVVETDNGGNASVEAIRFALLPERANPRRATLKEIPLVSSNTGCSGFVLPSGLTSRVPAPLTNDSTTSDIDGMERNCTEFVLYCTPDAPPVYSNNAGCAHFMMSNGLCSKAFTNEDIVWMERTADLEPGTLFRGFRSKDSSVAEHSSEPMTRYHSLPKAERRMPRGWKSWEHLENLRKSDPLTNLSAWLDVDQLYDSIKKTRAYKAHQAALIRRALHAHARATRQAGAGRMKASKGSMLRTERSSNDSIMAVDLCGVVIASGSSGGSDDDLPAEGSPTGVDTSLFNRLKVKTRAAPNKEKAATRQLFCDSPTSSVC